MLPFFPIAALLLMAPCGPPGPMASPAPFQDKSERERFANPELLVTTAWLGELGSGDGVAVVDARSAKNFKAGHVPGAVSIPTSSTFDPDVRGNIAAPEQIAALLGAQGIGASTHVVIYDEGRSTGAARVFWTLEVYGHERVAVLDGGFAKWQAEGREISTSSSDVSSVEYVVASRPERRSARSDILGDVENSKVVMLDARSSREYEAGRIPGAVHIDWARNYSADETPVFKSPAELRQLYSDQGVTRDKRVHAY